MRTITLIATLLVLLSLVSPAVADWQWSKWGMSVQEVIAASQNSAIATSPKEKIDNSTLYAISNLKMPYRANGMNFTAYFMFSGENEGLKCVSLKILDSDKISELQYEVNLIYGKPDIFSENTSVGLSTSVWYKEDSITSSIMNPPSTLKTKGFGSIYYCSRAKGGL